MHRGCGHAGVTTITRKARFPKLAQWIIFESCYQEDGGTLPTPFSPSIHQRGVACDGTTKTKHHVFSEGAPYVEKLFASGQVGLGVFGLEEAFVGPAGAHFGVECRPHRGLLWAFQAPDPLPFS